MKARGPPAKSSVLLRRSSAPVPIARSAAPSSFVACRATARLSRTASGALAQIAAAGLGAKDIVATVMQALGRSAAQPSVTAVPA